MVPIDHVERAQSEFPLQEEQAYELIARQQHDQLMRLYSKAEEDRKEAASAERAQTQLQQIYLDADRFAAEKQQAVDEAMHEAEDMEQVAQRREGLVRFP